MIGMSTVKVQAEIEIKAYEQILIEDYICKMKEKYPNIEMKPEDIYNTAFRRGLDEQLEHIRQERRVKMMEDWIYGTKSHKKTKK